MHDREPLREALGEPGATVSGVARGAGVSRGTVRRARDVERASLDERFREAIVAELTAWPWATIDELGESIGWPGSARHLARLAAELRPPFTPGVYRGLHVGVVTCKPIRNLRPASTGPLRSGSAHTDHQE